MALVLRKFPSRLACYMPHQFKMQIKNNILKNLRIVCCYSSNSTDSIFAQMTLEETETLNTNTSTDKSTTQMTAVETKLKEIDTLIKEKNTHIQALKLLNFSAKFEAVDKDEVVNQESDKDATNEKYYVEEISLGRRNPKLNLGKLSEKGTIEKGQLIVSKINCQGCGAFFQSQDKMIPGYISFEKLDTLSKSELKEEICHRCHLMKQYKIALDACMSSEDYLAVVQHIRNQHALILLVVDILDFPNSLYSQLSNIIGDRRPLYVVINKVDLLPQDEKTYLERVRSLVSDYFSWLGEDQNKYIKHIALVSAKTGFGVEALVTKLFKNWERKGDIYVVGSTNSGKSTLYNMLMNSDLCSATARDYIHKATISNWPGTTLNLLKFPLMSPSPFNLRRRAERLQVDKIVEQEHEVKRVERLQRTGKLCYAQPKGIVGQTFLGAKAKLMQDLKGFAGSSFTYQEGSFVDKGVETAAEHRKQVFSEHGLVFKEREYDNSRWCYDTPGFVNEQQIQNFLTAEEIEIVANESVIKPRTMVLKPKQVLLVSGLGRVEYTQGDVSIYFTLFASPRIPVHGFDSSEAADEFYHKHIGTKELGVPLGDENRVKMLPALKSSTFSLEGIGWQESIADITLSSVGWISVTAGAGHTVRVTVATPGGVGCVLRQPAMLPYAVNLRGRRIRSTPNYQQRKANVMWNIMNDRMEMIQPIQVKSLSYDAMEKEVRRKKF